MEVRSWQDKHTRCPELTCRNSQLQSVLMCIQMLSYASSSNVSAGRSDTPTPLWGHRSQASWCVLHWRLWTSSVKKYSLLCVGFVYYVFCEVGARVTTFRKRCLPPYLLCWFRSLNPAFCLLPPSLSFPLMYFFLCSFSPHFSVSFIYSLHAAMTPYGDNCVFASLFPLVQRTWGAAATPDLPDSHDKTAQMHLKGVSEHRPELGTVQLFVTLTSLLLPHVSTLQWKKEVGCISILPQVGYVPQVIGMGLFQYRHTQHGSPCPTSLHFHTSVLILLYLVIHTLSLNETYSFQRTFVAVQFFFLGEGQTRRGIMKFHVVTFL